MVTHVTLIFNCLFLVFKCKILFLAIIGVFGMQNSRMDQGRKTHPFFWYPSQMNLNNSPTRKNAHEELPSARNTQLRQIKPQIHYSKDGKNDRNLVVRNSIRQILPNTEDQSNIFKKYTRLQTPLNIGEGPKINFFRKYIDRQTFPSPNNEDDSDAYNYDTEPSRQNTPNADGESDYNTGYTYDNPNQEQMLEYITTDDSMYELSQDDDAPGKLPSEDDVRVKPPEAKREAELSPLLAQQLEKHMKVELDKIIEDNITCSDCAQIKIENEQLKAELEKETYKGDLLPAYACNQWFSINRTCWLDRNIGDTVTFVLRLTDGPKKHSNVQWRQEFHLINSNKRRIYNIDADKPMWNVVIGSRGHELRLSPISEIDIDSNSFSAILATPHQPSGHKRHKVNFRIRLIPIDQGFIYPGETLVLNMRRTTLPKEGLSFKWFMEGEGETSTLPSNMRLSPGGEVLSISELRQEQEGNITCSVFTNKGFFATKQRYMLREIRQVNNLLLFTPHLHSSRKRRSLDAEYDTEQEMDNSERDYDNQLENEMDSSQIEYDQHSFRNLNPPAVDRFENNEFRVNLGGDQSIYGHSDSNNQPIADLGPADEDIELPVTVEEPSQDTDNIQQEISNGQHSFKNLNPPGVDVFKNDGGDFRVNLEGDQPMYGHGDSNNQFIANLGPAGEDTELPVTVDEPSQDTDNTLNEEGFEYPFGALETEGEGIRAEGDFTADNTQFKTKMYNNQGLPDYSQFSSESGNGQMPSGKFSPRTNNSKLDTAPHVSHFSRETEIANSGDRESNIVNDNLGKTKSENNNFVNRNHENNNRGRSNLRFSNLKNSNLRTINLGNNNLENNNRGNSDFENINLGNSAPRSNINRNNNIDISNLENSNLRQGNFISNTENSNLAINKLRNNNFGNSNNKINNIGSSELKSSNLGNGNFQNKPGNRNLLSSNLVNNNFMNNNPSNINLGNSRRVVASTQSFLVNYGGMEETNRNNKIENIILEVDRRPESALAREEDNISKLMASCISDLQCAPDAVCVQELGFCRCTLGFRGNGLFCWAGGRNTK